MVRRKVDVEYMEKIVNEKDVNLLNLKDALDRAADLLADQKDYYKIGGRRYTYAEVARDASEKMKLYKVQEETLVNLKRTLDTKVKTLVLAEENVTKSESIKGELRAKVKFMRAQLERYKAKEVYAETVQVDDTHFEFKTLIGQTQKMLTDFEKQLEVKDRLLDERINLGGGYVGGIDYDTTHENLSEDDIAGEIKRYFNRDGGEERPLSEGAKGEADVQ